MSSLRIVLFLACCGAGVHPNLVLAGQGIEEPTKKNEILSHPEVKGALRAIDAWVEGVRTYDRVPGLSIGIVLDQDLIWHSGYGYSNLEEMRPADANTLYSICSMSKMFTSIGIMQLRDANELRLQDSVQAHLDWFNVTQAFDNSGPITIEGLLTHTSGLPVEAAFPYWNGPDFPFPTRQQMIEALKTQSTLYPATRRLEYSNLGFAIAGEIVQERSGQEYQAYMKANILDPLGLSNTRTYYPEEMRGDELAIGYVGIGRSGTREPTKAFFAGGMTPAVGFTSSVVDMAKFASWQFRLLEDGGREVLNANTLREMHRIHWADDDFKLMYGLGFWISRDEDMTIVGHGGGCPGYVTSFRMSTKDKIATIAMTNTSDGPAQTVASNALRTIRAALSKAKTPSQETLPDFSMYEGNYDVHHEGGELAVRQWGDQLVVVKIPSDDLGKAMTRLKHVDGHAFVRLTDGGELREPWVFELADDGKAKRIYQHGWYWSRIEETNNQLRMGVR